MVGRKCIGWTTNAAGTRVPVLEVEQTLDERRLLTAYRALPRNERDDVLRRIEVQSLNWRTPGADLTRSGGDDPV